jgi:hypothetical protein
VPAALQQKVSVRVKGNRGICPVALFFNHQMSAPDRVERNLTEIFISGLKAGTFDMRSPRIFENSEMSLIKLIHICTSKALYRCQTKQMLQLYFITELGRLSPVSRLFPLLYNTTDSVRHLATWLICINACMMPFNSYTNATYFTLRSGGQVMVTFLFDSCFVWTVCIPLAYCLSRFTYIGIIPLFAICLSTDLIKCLLGTLMLRKGKWIQNLTA